MGRRIASESKQTVRGGPKPAKVGLHRRLRPPPPIEIINNTRGGIVILIQSKKGNAAIGGQI